MVFEREVWKANKDVPDWLKEIAKYGDTCPKIYGISKENQPKACNAACRHLIKSLEKSPNDDYLPSMELLIKSCGNGIYGGHCGEAILKYLEIEKVSKIPNPHKIVE